MASDLFVALSASIANLRQSEIAAQNIANATTTGYKADRVSFAQVLSVVEGDELIPTFSPDVIQGVPFDTSVYVGSQNGRIDFRQGGIEPSGGELDVAIEGDGFFEVQTPAGPRFTRSGAFKRTGSGEVQTQFGFPVLGSGGPLVLPAGDVSIAPDGTIAVNGSTVGQVRVVSIADPNQLAKEGNSLFRLRAGAPAPTPATDVQVRHGYLERSNVNAVEELVRLITASRSFEMTNRTIEAHGRLDEQAIQSVSRSVP